MPSKKHTQPHPLRLYLSESFHILDSHIALWQHLAASLSLRRQLHARLHQFLHHCIANAYILDDDIICACVSVQLKARISALSKLVRSSTNHLVRAVRLERGECFARAYIITFQSCNNALCRVLHVQCMRQFLTSDLCLLSCRERLQHHRIPFVLHHLQ